MKGHDRVFPENVSVGKNERGYAYTERSQHLGLTKRELLAAMAMQGLCSCPNVTYPNAANFHVGLAEDAVKYADALLAELSKE